MNSSEKLDKFREEYCKTCGSQRCAGEYFENCQDYRQYMKNPDMPNVNILDHFDKFNINLTFLYPKGKSKYELIKEITDWMKEYRKKNNVVIVNNDGKPFLFEE
jgi:hypothetical protein